MPDDIRDRAETERRLWDEIESGGGTGMLGLTGDTAQLPQPMTAFVEREGNLLWFFSRDDSDFVRTVGAASRALFTVQYDKLQAAIVGDLAVGLDRERRDRFWGPTVAAWYPGGKDDPHLTMLRLACREAQVWVASVGPIGFAWEIARANVTKTIPDIGGSTEVTFDQRR